MNAPLRHAELNSERTGPTAWTTRVVDGLPQQIDEVAAAAPATHRFLRRQWFAAAQSTYGGEARTVVVECDGRAEIALPLVASGPAALGLASVPGCYWPFRSFPAATDAPAAWDAAVAAVGASARGLRVGPVYDGDPGVAALLDAARRAGWAVLDRFVADSYLLDIAARRAEGPWPRNSTLRKNRFHEKHLSEHGTLAWEFIREDDWDVEAFDDLAAVERRSWIAARTDGSDAKFTDDGHGRFWREAARDPALAALMHAAVLRVEGTAAAFSFDLDLGATRYAIANSYDPRFARYSPGKLLYYRNLVDAADRGVRTVDWGAGDSGYKRVIGADAGPAIRDWLLLRPGWPARLGGPLRSLWRRSGNRPA